MIKGRTLESRNLKELLARAVTEKRNQDRKATPLASSSSRTLVAHAANLYCGAGRTAAF